MVRLPLDSPPNGPSKRQKADYPPLRVVTILTWVPAFALSLPYGIDTGIVVPALGILPMSFSAVTGIFHLSGWARSRVGNLLMEIFCSCFLMGVLIASWVVLSDPWNHRSLLMLGSYATVPMMVNFAIHTYIAVLALWSLLTSGRSARLCPHCHGDLSSHKPIRSLGHDSYGPLPEQETGTINMVEDDGGDGGSKESFHSSVQAQEGEASSSKDPRPSTDDETARLL